MGVGKVFYEVGKKEWIMRLDEKTKLVVGELSLRTVRDEWRIARTGLLD
jgi:hypothetical protein